MKASMMCAELILHTFHPAQTETRLRVTNPSEQKLLWLCAKSTSFDKGGRFEVSRPPIINRSELTAYTSARAMAPHGTIALPDR
eukprot:1662096-Pleurochrysis_carterae.AAC.2